MAPKFVPRERKHRKLARQKEANRKNGVPQHEDGDQANATEIVPATQSEKDERRRKLKEELAAAQPESKGSSKKRKRLDKYIETKLKKEENKELLEKIAAQRVDTSLLKSSKQLSRVSETRREQLQRALKEREAGIKGNYDEILFERRPEVSRERDDEPAEDDIESAPGDQQRAVNAEQLLRDATVEVTADVKTGGGLKRPLELDDSGRPVIKRRKRQKKSTARQPRIAFNPEPSPPLDADDDDEDDDQDSDEGSDVWNGFDTDGGASESQGSDMSEDDHGSSTSGEDESMTDGSEDTDEEDEDASEDKPARVSAFKAWADSQRNEAVGFVPSSVLDNQDAAKAAFKPRDTSPDLAAVDIAAASRVTENTYRPAGAVIVDRELEIQEARLRLPVVQDEQKIMERVHHNPVTIVCGATGSGKTTQLPQMLLENGYATKGMIGITQPRRVAATSVADRVKYELGKTHGKQVAHQVRFDSSVSRDTKIKFMTDGILLREISQDFALQKYSAIVIDEAHERSVNTDILIGMLSRIVPLRQDLSREKPEEFVPLKLIIMSATLRVADFLSNDRLFRVKPPIVEAEGRQHKVTEHFARKTQRDYVAEMVRKVARGHKKLPPGDILVFLTGQDDIQTVQKRLKEQLMLESASFQLSTNRASRDKVINDFIEDDGKGEADDSDSEAEITGLDNAEDDDAEFAVDADATTTTTPRGPLKPQILPLYAALPKAQQDQVFVKTPEGSRKIILATNVAETSLTIDGIKYVFDCGRSKEKKYDIETGVQQFVVGWVSQASASQRMGRAGRTGPGHCYRLYSSAIYERFEKHTLPEILRTPIEGTVLQLKNMKVDNVVNFPFPTPPQLEQLAQAERLLKNLGAIDARTGQVAATGRELINYPVNPRFGKMLMLGRHYEVLPFVIALVAGLAVGDLFIPEPQIARKDSEDEDSDYESRSARKLMDAAAQSMSEKRRQAYGRAREALSYKGDTSDAMKVLTAVVAHAHAETENGSAAFCEKHFLREKGMSEVQALRRQLHNLTEGLLKDVSDHSFKPTLSPPSDKEVGRIKQIAAAGYIDQVAVRYDLLPGAVSVGRKPQRAIEVAYRTLQASNTDVDRQASMQEQERQKCVFVHSSSPLARLSTTEMPAYICYSSLSRSGATPRTRLHPLTPVTQAQLASLAEGTPLLDVGKPIGKIEEIAGGKRQCWVSVALRDPSNVGSTGWPLKAWKVLQSKKGKEWTIEKVLDRGK